MENKIVYIAVIVILLFAVISGFPVLKKPIKKLFITRHATTTIQQKITTTHLAQPTSTIKYPTTTTLRRQITSTSTVLTTPTGTGKPNDFEYAFVIEKKAEFDGLTSKKIEFIANHFASMEVAGVSGLPLKETAEELKSFNSDFKVIKYTNGPFDYSYKPKDEDCYLHSPSSPHNNNRIRDTGIGKGFGLDMCGNCWRTFFLDSAKTDMQYGFDGIMADDMSALVSRFDYAPPYAQEEWHKCKKDFLDYVKTNLDGKTVFFNGLYHQYPKYPATDFLDVTDGGLKEGFISVLAKYDSFLSEEHWKILLNLILEDIPSDKLFLANCKYKNADVNDRMFCFTSFLLIYSPNVVYMFKDPNINGPQYYPEMGVDIGSPIETKNTVEGYLDRGVYVREYSKGKVIVNPGNRAVNYRLDKKYSLVIPSGGGIVQKDGTYDGTLDYREVTEVTVPAQTGVILLEKAAESGKIGYVGCSLTLDARAGYEVRGGARFWPAIPDYNGGAIRRWSDDISDNNPYWSGFQNALERYPETKIIWWELCGTERYGDEDNYGNALRVLDEIKRRVPGAEIYVSTQPHYAGGHVCDLLGEGGSALVEQVADELVAKGKALRGPMVGPLAPSQLRDDCHANNDGRALMGSQLIEFFGS